MAFYQLNHGRLAGSFLITSLSEENWQDALSVASPTKHWR